MRFIATGSDLATLALVLKAANPGNSDQRFANT